MKNMLYVGLVCLCACSTIQSELMTERVLSCDDKETVVGIDKAYRDDGAWYYVHVPDYYGVVRDGVYMEKEGEHCVVYNETLPLAKSLR